jgi:hypothetical protein
MGFASNSEDGALVLDSDGIQVYVYQHDNFEFGAFKATTFIAAPLNSVLAVMFDHNDCQDWIYSCIESRTIKEVSFNERYHYQMLNLPFPFQDREFILHSVLKQDPSTKTVTIRTTTALDNCDDNNFYLCKHPQEAGHVKVELSVGLFELEPVEGGVNFTWIQYTNPAGELPGWLLNQFLKQLPYQTLIRLAQKAKQQPYQNAKIIYDRSGKAVALRTD